MTFIEETIISGIIGGFISKVINDGVDVSKDKIKNKKAIKEQLLEEHKRLLKDMKLSGKKIYPNDLCPCGSGKKFKMCYGKLF